MTGGEDKENGERIELRDVDGTFISGIVLDHKHLRVVLSNVASRGVVLVNPSDLSWQAAAHSLGSETLLSPHDLLDPSHVRQQLERGPGGSGTPGEEVVRVTKAARGEQKKTSAKGRKNR